MPCTHVKFGDGATAIVCTKGRGSRCAYCPAPAELACDFPWPAHRSGTCDRALCRKHATTVGPDRDYCDPTQTRMHPVKAYRVGMSATHPA